MDQREDKAFLCKLSEIGESGKEVRLAGESGIQWLMLFMRDGTLTAWRNVCPHQGRSLNFAPDKFLFSDKGHLVCCHHGASFDLSEGICVEGPCKGAALTPVDVDIEGDDVLINK